MGLEACTTCGYLAEPKVALAVQQEEFDPQKFCSIECFQNFRKWAESGTSMSLFQWYLLQKYPRANV